MVEAINQPIPTLPDNTDPTLVLSVLNSETQEGEDYSANGNDAVTVTDVRFNDEGGIFNGSTSEIDLPAGDVLITDKDNFSISGRFKADTIAAGANSQRIITIFRSGGGSGFSIATGNNNQLQLLYRSGADAFVTVVMATISTGQWYTFFVTNNGTSIISYVDNETPITTTDTILGVDNTPVQMGSAGGAAFFDGMIDEVNIHSVPKPADHVSEQFKKGVPDSSLVLHVTDG
ncbi:MAG: LamG domain-containing protein, partial [Candidatus Aenigmarchaeota archaeon]|nr:LamG domain-containing protein [Candidatus Aenigmarchaeota archaeon]